jgi:hypothetical protein
VSAWLVPENASKLIDIRGRRHKIEVELGDRTWKGSENKVVPAMGCRDAFLQKVQDLVHTYLTNASHCLGPELQARKTERMFNCSKPNRIRHQA